MILNPLAQTSRVFSARRCITPRYGNVFYQGVEKFSLGLPSVYVSFERGDRFSFIVCHGRVLGLNAVPLISRPEQLDCRKMPAQAAFP